MMNHLGKGLALLHVGLSIAFATLAVALYLNAVDFGWSQPARYWRETAGKKGQNLLIASQYDKREAALRQVVRARQDELRRLAATQNNLSRIDTLLGENHVAGAAALDKLEQGPGTFKVFDVKYDGNSGLVLKPGGHPQYGFPSLEIEVAGLDASYSEYRKKLAELEKDIQAIHVATEELIAREKDVTERLLGEVDKDGHPIRDKSGTVLQPGLRYVLEAEYQMQRELQRELEHVEPLWLKELVDTQQVRTRRDTLLRRLNELVGERGYLSESEFLRKMK